MHIKRMNMKFRIICISRPLKAAQAVNVARHFHDLFEPLFVCADHHGALHQKGYQHYYYVVRIPSRRESEIVGHEMNVNVREIFGIIPKYDHANSRCALFDRANHYLHVASS